MIKNVADLSSQNFSGGLNTNSDIFNLEKNQSPNMMNVKINFDGSIEKRMGSVTANTTIITPSGNKTFSSGAGTLTSGLISFWKLDEANGQRLDSNSSNSLTDNNTVSNAAGKLSNAALFVSANSESLSRVTNGSLQTGDINFSISSWFYLNTTGNQVIASKRNPDYATSLLLHCNGTDASTSFPDSGLHNHTVTANGNAQVDTAQKQFGSASALFDGTGDYLSIPDHPDWQLGGGSGDFTIDFWVRFNSLAGGDNAFLSQKIDDNSYWLFRFEAPNILNFEVKSGGSLIVDINNTWSPSINTWYHVALVKSSNIYRMFIDGTQIGSDASDSDAIPDFSASLDIGRFSGNPQDLNGWLDEIRISTIARWSSNFTVPSAEYTLDLSEYEYSLEVEADNFVYFKVSSSGTGTDGLVRSDSFGAVSTATWYHAVAWHDTADLIGVVINLSVTSAAYASGLRASTSNSFVIGAAGAINSANYFMNGRIDEVGFWKKLLTVSEWADLYNSGNANTLNDSFQGYPWASFDFGANTVRWFTVAAGTGVYASSDLGANFTTIGTSQTATYQYFERSKNILVKGSDAYQAPLYWAGSGGTFMAILNASAPNVKYAINYQGFLILLNSNTRKRGFYYEDENTQLTGDWADSFDIPSSADDEITGAFILRKKLYVSTRYKVFRVSFVGGSPDWSYLEVRDWGFIPRTAKKCFLKDVGEVIVGLSWDRRIRMFDGSEDKIISDNIENDNGMCEFALNKISYAGSGLIISHAEYDSNEQVYKLCVAIGENTDQTTHIINFNGRTLSFYPYSNQPWNTMAVAESNNRRYLLGVSRSSRVHILDSSNQDVATPVDDIFDSPFLYEKSPSEKTKNYQLDLYFTPTSSNTVYFYDRNDFSDSFKERHRINLVDTGGFVQIVKNIDIPMTNNVAQYRISSSSNTAEPWRLNRADFFTKGLGIGKN